MPEVTESDFRKILSRGEFGTRYYLCGEEKLLVSQYTNQLIERAAGKEPDDFNFHVFKEKFSVDEFEAAALMIPFTSRYNVVVVKDIDFRDFAPDESSRIIDIVDKTAGDTVMIFTFPTKTSGGGDDNAAGSKAAAAAKDRKLKTIFQKKGTVVEFKKLTPALLINKLTVSAEKRNVILEKKNATLLVEYCGTELNRLRMELDKLCAYVGEGGEIRKEDIDLLVPRGLESRVFDLSNAIINRRAADSFRILDTLLANQEEEIPIVSVIAMAYVNIYRVRMAIKSGARSSELKNWFKYSDAQLRYAERDSRNTTTAALRRSINVIAQTDMALKSTRTSKRLLLELLIEKLLIIAAEDGRR